MSEPIKLLGLAGSLRRGSYNRGLLQAAAERMAEGGTLHIFDLAPLPMYNRDLEEGGFPDPVMALREAIRGCDALLIATPEYNYGLPAVLKNALDWASRPPERPLSGKPAAIMGAGGRYGTVRAQQQLRYVALGLNLLVLNQPQLMIRVDPRQYDSRGRPTDEELIEQVTALTGALLTWVRRLRHGAAG